jgi:asparagine N-glycosylation enzyme membrane subunit Stt3
VKLVLRKGQVGIGSKVAVGLFIVLVSSAILQTSWGKELTAAVDVHLLVPIAIIAAVVALMWRRRRESNQTQDISEEVVRSTSRPLTFRNPANNYVEAVRNPGIWCLLFGCFYLAYKGAWGPAFIAFGLAFLTVGFSWLIFPFFAAGLIRKAYLQRGWIEVS